MTDLNESREGMYVAWLELELATLGWMSEYESGVRLTVLKGRAMPVISL